jgi:hypothetical protein
MKLGHSFLGEKNFKSTKRDYFFMFFKWRGVRLAEEQYGAHS